MKRIFTLFVFVLIVLVSKSQAVLNEIYPQPGNGYQEFFELYNPGTSPTPENMDNYTLITYYEESGGKSGFYVFDLPDISINPNGFYVASSKLNFDIQWQLGLAANSNWNSLPSGGQLTKWQKNGSSYTSVTVPANLNDLFVKITGAGGVFHVFVYKNGILVNGIIGGTNSLVIPPYIKDLPDLFVDMSGSSPDFTIKFSAIADNSIEYISSSVGTNNGYFRSADGKCGEWLKSDSPGQHTPGFTNGSAENVSAQLHIAATISQYEADPGKSLLTYNITGGSIDAFPVLVTVYTDYGIAEEYDVNDSPVDSRNIDSATASSQHVLLPAANVSVILVVQSTSGCYSQTITVGNFPALLPVQLLSFYGNINKNNKITLQWKVGINETVDQFEVQKSNNGIEFKTIGIVFASEKTGAEDYTFYETNNNADKIIYRLKMIDKRQDINYSKNLVFQAKLSAANEIKIYGNPVNDKLTFSYASHATQIASVRIYDLAGKVLMSQKINSLEGSNMISLPLNTSFKPGMFAVEISNDTDRLIAKFVKQ